MSETVYDLESGGALVVTPAATEGLRVGSGLVRDTQHTAEALNRLLQQFKDKQKIEDFLSALSDQVQDFEDAWWVYYIACSLADATGDLLDKYGAKVGEDRRGRTDDVYRTFIATRILTNRSDGQVEELYTILRAIFGGSFEGGIDEFQPATMFLELNTPIDSAVAPESEIDLVLKRAKGAGVRFFAAYSHDDPADQLRGDSIISPNPGANGVAGSTVSGGGQSPLSVHEV